MHIPNGFLDPKTSAGAAFAAAGVLGYCLSKVRQALSHAVPEAALVTAGNIATNITKRSKKIVSSMAENHLMKMAAVASLIFSAQMFNFPIDNGTSGHILGGIVAAIILGPFSGTLAISAILFYQSFFFADGGLTVLGANIFNMAVIGTFASYYIYYAINRLIKSKVGYFIGVFIASFFSVLLASVFCALELSISGTIPLSKVLPAMASIHARIGLAEAFLTILVLEFLSSINIEREGKVINE
jgi:cobalt/nickel transport system permease protein